MHYTIGMTKRSEYFRIKNKVTPVLPVRLPSPEHHDEIRTAASSAGLSVSEWVRSAIGKALEAPSTMTN